MSEEKTMLQFDLARKQHLRAAYDKAVEEKQTEFVFEGIELLADYAKYMLEYLDTQLPDQT